MATGKDNMTLSMRILARANEALRALRSVRTAVGAIGAAAVRMAAMTRTAFRVVTSAVRTSLAPLRALTAGAMVLGAVFAGTAAKSLAFAGEAEALQLRLQSVTATTAQAAAVFKDVQDLAIASPFETPELAEAAIGLLNIGIYGRKSLESIGDAASATQKPIQDVIAAITNPQRETLMKFGIEASSALGKYTFAFRDRMGEVRRIVADGVGDARAQLLKIFDIKYGGGMASFANAWKGLTSSFTDLLKQAATQFGNGLMPVAKRFVGDLNNRLTTLINSGVLADWGARAGEAIQTAIDYAAATVSKAQDVFTALQKSGPNAMRQAVGVWASAAGEIMARAYLNYLTGMKDVFVGLAKVMSSAFQEDILSLPGMSGARSAARIRATRDIERQANLSGDFSTANRVRGMVAASGDLTLEQEMEIIALGAGAAFQRGIDQAMRGLTTITAGNAQMAKDVLDKAAAGIQAIVPDTGPSIEQRAALIAAARSDANMPAAAFGDAQQYRATIRTPIARRTATGVVHDYAYTQRDFLAAPGAYKNREVVDRPGGVRVLIQNLTVRANDLKHMQNELLRSAGVPAMASAAVSP